MKRLAAACAVALGCVALPAQAGSDLTEGFPDGFPGNLTIVKVPTPV